MLTGCDVTHRDSVQRVLKAVSQWNDRAQALLFRPNHLAPTYSPDKVVKPPRFNAYYDVEDMAPVDGRDVEARAGRPHLRQAAVDAAPDLRAARAGDHRPPHLRRGLGLHRPMVGREPSPVPRAHRRRSHRQVRRLPLRRRLLRQHRHGLGAASANLAGDQIRRGTDAPTPLVFRCACARPSSSASRTRNGSPPWRSPTPTAAATGRIAASTGSAAFEERRNGRRHRRQTHALLRHRRDGEGIHTGSRQDAPRPAAHRRRTPPASTPASCATSPTT